MVGAGCYGENGGHHKLGRVVYFIPFYYIYLGQRVFLIRGEYKKVK